MWKFQKKLQIDNTLKYAHWNLALFTMNYIWKSYKKMNEFKIVISNNSLNKKDMTKKWLKNFLQKSAHYKSVSISTYLQILKIWLKNDIFLPGFSVGLFSSLPKNWNNYPNNLKLLPSFALILFTFTNFPCLALFLFGMTINGMVEKTTFSSGVTAASAKRKLDWSIC